jgi:hypothetical protein
MVSLKIPPEEAILRITERIDAIQTIPGNQSGPEYYEFVRWCSKTWQAIDGIYGADDVHAEELRMLGIANCSCNSALQAQILVNAFHTRLLEYIGEIRAGMEIKER